MDIPPCKRALGETPCVPARGHVADSNNAKDCTLVRMGKAKPKLAVESDPSNTPQSPGTDMLTSAATISSEDKLDKILTAVKHTRESLVSKIDTVAVNLNLLRDDHKKMSERVVAMERSIREL